MRIPDKVVASVFEPLWDRYEGSLRLKTLTKLNDSQWQSPAAYAEHQNELLRRVITHAVATCPFYQERFTAAGIDPAKVSSIADLAGLPLLTKADVRENQSRLISSRYEKSQLVLAKTGGSTGISLEIFCDRQGVEMRQAAALRADEWSGWRLGQPMAAIWGNPPVPRTFRNRMRKLLKDRIIYLDTMRIDSAAIDNFLGEWEATRPGLLYGHAHSIFILCEALRDRGLTLNPTGIVATSMMLIESERRVIEEVCGIKVTNRYGCEEVSLISCECEEHRGMHLNADHNIIEFLRDDGTPCAPGEDGRIVVTELINFGMPMIRYEVGDRGVPSDRTCACGRGMPLMEHVTGRVADFLVATDGARVAGISIIENTLTKLPGIVQMQAVQEEPRLVKVNVVRGDSYGADTEQGLRQSMKGFLGQDVEIQIEQVSQIPQESSGKYRFTICRLKDQATK